MSNSLKLRLSEIEARTNQEIAHTVAIMALSLQMKIVNIKETREKILEFKEGWQEAHYLHLLDKSPRALWELARARVLPITETESLRMIIDAGKSIEQEKRSVTPVRVVKSDSPTALLLRATRGRRPRSRSFRSPTSKIF